jgi:hypothetical protein
MHTAYRAYRKGPDISSREEQWKTARNTYFHAVRSSKIQHWEQFLQEATERIVFKAMKSTKPGITSKIPTINYTIEGIAYQATTFEEKCRAFISTLFPAPTTATAPHTTVPTAPIAPQTTTPTAPQATGYP